MKEAIVGYMLSGLDTHAKMAKDESITQLQRGIALSTYFRLRSYIEEVKRGDAPIEWLIAETILFFMTSEIESEMESTPARDLKARMEIFGEMAQSPASVDEIYNRLSELKDVNRLVDVLGEAVKK